MRENNTNRQIIHTRLEMTRGSMPWSSMRMAMENTEEISIPRSAVIKASFSGGSWSSPMDYAPEYGALVLGLRVLEDVRTAGGPYDPTALERLDGFRDVVELRFTGNDRDKTIILPYVEQYGLGSENSLQKNTFEDGLFKIEWGTLSGQE